MPDHEVTHGDILRAIGNIEGQLTAIITSNANNRSDLNNAFQRLRQVEVRVAQGVILAVFLSLVMPIVVSAASLRLHFGHEPPSEARPR
jgi:hypothetical protein